MLGVTCIASTCKSHELHKLDTCVDGVIHVRGAVFSLLSGQRGSVSVECLVKENNRMTWVWFKKLTL